MKRGHVRMLARLKPRSVDDTVKRTVWEGLKLSLTECDYSAYDSRHVKVPRTL